MDYGSIHSFYLTHKQQLLGDYCIWDETTCSAVRISQRFGGNYGLHLQDR